MMGTLYVFRTKFAKDLKLNGQKCYVTKDYGNGMLQVKFVSTGVVRKIYNTELEGYLC
jgi:hypothetical protein